MNPNDKNNIAKPEKTAGHGDNSKKFLPSESDKPREGIGGCAPNPRNESEASTSIAAESNKLDWTNITDIKFGKTWKKLSLNQRRQLK